MVAVCKYEIVLGSLDWIRQNAYEILHSAVFYGGERGLASEQPPDKVIRTERGCC